jgi:hypothetical protein
MSGDLSISPRLAGGDLAATAGAIRARSARPSTLDGGAGSPAAPAGAPGASQSVEVEHLRSLLTDPAMRVSAHRDEVTGRTILQVERRATGELIEQIPSEALLRLYTAMRESLLDECA